MSSTKTANRTADRLAVPASASQNLTLTIQTQPYVQSSVLVAKGRAKDKTIYKALCPRCAWASHEYASDSTAQLMADEHAKHCRNGG